MLRAAGHRLRTTFQLLSKEEFEARTSTKAPAGKRYFQHRRLADIVGAYPLPEVCLCFNCIPALPCCKLHVLSATLRVLPPSRLVHSRAEYHIKVTIHLCLCGAHTSSSRLTLVGYRAHTHLHRSVQGCTEADAQLERQDREAFVDFLLGVLDMDPATRWTPRQVPHRLDPLKSMGMSMCLVSIGSVLSRKPSSALTPTSCSEVVHHPPSAQACSDLRMQALQHPFINTGVQFTGPFQPPPDQHLPGFKAMQRQQEEAYRMTGSLAGVLPSPGATALLATSPQAHEQAHAVAVAAMAQLSPQLGSQLLQHRYSAHGAGGHSLPAPRLGMPGTSPPQTVTGYGGAASAASFGGAAAWGQTRHSGGGGARYGSPQPLMQQSATGGGGGGERSMFSPAEPPAAGLQHSSGSAAQVSSRSEWTAAQRSILHIKCSGVDAGALRLTGNSVSCKSPWSNA